LGNNERKASFFRLNCIRIHISILFTVPLALFGVSVFFSVINITLNTSSYLGLLTLFGIVVNNGIILIDHIRNLRKSGLSKKEAIVQGGKDRGNLHRRGEFAF